jgi:hypothetical protein
VNSGAAEDEKKHEDTKEVVKSRQSKKNRHYHAHKKKKTDKRQMIHLILLRKLKIDQQEPHYKPRLNPSVLEGKSIPDLLTAPIV